MAELQQDVYTLLPHVDETWLDLCVVAINEASNQNENATPVFNNKRHLLCEIVVTKSLRYIEDELTVKEREFCYAVEDYIQDNAGDEANWNVKHIPLEDDESDETTSLTDMSDMIDSEKQEGSGLKIGDRLFIENEGHFSAKMRVMGFDESNCPFVKYTKVTYAPGAKPEGDAFQAGDILPFPWSNPSQYKVTNTNGEETNTRGN